MMKTRKLWLALCVGVLAAVTAIEAAAWSDAVRRAISSTAVQLIRREQPAAFKATTSIATRASSDKVNVSYEEDVLRGASEGVDALKGYSLSSDENAVVAVGSEIQLLRAVRQYGMGSYFAYRMGALGGLVSELILPFSLDTRPEVEKLSRQMEADIDEHFDSFRFTPERTDRRYISNPHDYFREVRTFVADDRRIIVDDYVNGSGYGGLLSKGAEVYFGRSVEAVADAWFTVLRPEPVGNYVPPSDKVITRYFVLEIDYLLTVKNNLFQAERAYQNFAEVNPGMWDAYERVGDLFYAFGTDDAQQRGVREWKMAYDHPGPQRKTAAAKLNAHYLSEGEKYLQEAEKPGASETLLENALTSFKQALDYDRSNAMAAQRINETTTAIAKKRERREFQDSLIAQGTKIMQEAEKASLQNDFGTAIHTYNQAATMFEAVTDEFEDLSNAAAESIKQVDKGKRDVVNSVIEAADAKIEEGDRLVEARDFDNAINVYQYVETIVNAIPEGEGGSVEDEKADMIARAQEKVQEAKTAQERWKAQQEAAQAAG